MTLLNIVFLFSVVGFASFFATGLILKTLERRGMVDTPNERSSHTTPTPRGAGLAVIIVIIAAWCFSISDISNEYMGLVIGTLLLVITSWIDDIKSLSARIRLLSQFISVALVLWLMPENSLYFHGIFPDWLDTIIVVLMWVWFINLFNFMDGIDGISVVEASTIGLGVFILMVLGKLDLAHGLLGLIILASAIGFVWWNWHPAKVFLGDVGSIPLGFLLGWLLLKILSTPYWPVAIILPLYYLADASITLTGRIWRSERIWHAHRKHFYQQATARGLSHAQVSMLIGGTNLILIALAILSLAQPLAALCCSFVSVGILLLILREPRNGGVS